MPSKPIPGSTGDILATLPSPYLPHAATGLLYLPRFIAKCRYVKAHGALPPSYAKNYKRGCDRFLSQHLGIDPAAVEKEAKDIFAKHKVPEKQDGDNVDMNDETKMRAMLKEKLKDVPDKGALAGDLIMFMKKHSKKGSDFSMFEGTVKDVKIDGDKATATLSKPDGKSSDIKFAKKDGRWYLALGK